MDFLRWLEGLRTGIGDTLFGGLTLLGGETAFMVVAIAVFWCVNKKWGYYLFTVGFAGTILSQFLKLICRVPRPWIVDPNFTIVEAARADATGYSFPSGHTQNAVGTFGGLALCARKSWPKWMIGILLALVVLIPFSRMYLGVHYPSDVGAAFLCAVVLLIAIYPLVMKSDAHPRRMLGLFVGLLVLCAGYIVFVNCILDPASFQSSTDELANYTEGVKNGWSLTGALLGLLTVWVYDTRKQHFEEKAPLLGQLCKLVLGLGIIIAIRVALAKLFELLFPGQLFWNLPRYFLMVIAAGCLWPKTFPFWQKLGAKKEA